MKSVGREKAGTLEDERIICACDWIAQRVRDETL
jgi:hypothetical protein